MSTPWSVGSRWLRWDPHIHAPGTLKNDNFKGDMEDYISRIERASPMVSALGITDYYSLRTYEQVLKYRQNGRLPNVELIFPNIELRLTLQTKKGGPVNLHLLVSPDDNDHIEQIKECLQFLTMSYKGELFRCSEAGLKKLGRVYDPDSTKDPLEVGANQFVVRQEQLQELREKSHWFRQNVLLALPAGNDGLSGVKDSSLAATRETLAGIVDIIFSSNPTDRAFWGGERISNESDRFPKPCLHGCDAHSPERVLNPDMDRICWIRAEPTFSGLCQTLVEPLRRVSISPTAPSGPPDTHVISSIAINGAPWLKTPNILLNDGLITIIGERGSGKTALADLIAYAASAEDPEPGPASFMKKASPLLGNIVLELTWKDGTHARRPIESRIGASTTTATSKPRVRYLSQQFVERLCSADGTSDALVGEIESVVFAATSEASRLKCLDFKELRDFLLQDIRAQVKTLQTQIEEESTHIQTQRSVQAQITEFQTHHERVGQRILELESEINRLSTQQSNSNQSQMRAYEQLTASIQRLESKIALHDRRAVLFANLSSELERDRKAIATSLGERKIRYGQLLTAVEWEQMAPEFANQTFQLLQEHVRSERATVETLRRMGDASNSEFTGGILELNRKLLETQKALGLSQDNERRRIELIRELESKKETKRDTEIKLRQAKEAPQLITQSISRRLQAYQELFQKLVDEEKILRDLYQPLASHLQSETGLTVNVRRRANIDRWVAIGEALIDLRRLRFPERDGMERSLRSIADTELRPIWENGTAEEARQAIGTFASHDGAAGLSARLKSVTAATFGSWVFSTDHISVEYEILYEGVPLSKLSPGTRGVVLLLLYLQIDKWDMRPLIIDQPEENLDPKSVFGKLVPLFRQASTQRQIIMVTHNANLVVNTDSDQVIVTSSHRPRPTGLPDIQYQSGGIENGVIRDQICEILEGGKDAFLRRSRRYSGLELSSR